jgi:hypothetical protein
MNYKKLCQSRLYNQIYPLFILQRTHFKRYYLVNIQDFG